MQELDRLSKKFNTEFQSASILADDDMLNYFSRLTNDEIANIVMKDHLTSFSVLKYANKITPGRVATISSAVNLIGSVAIAETFRLEQQTVSEKTFSFGPFESFTYRKKSLFTAIVAIALIKEIDLFNRASPELAYVVGLLSSLGDLPLLCNNSTNHYSKHMSGNTFPWDIQESLTGYNQFDCAFNLLDSWRIPKEVTLPIKHLTQFALIDTNPYLHAVYGANLLALPFVYPENYNIHLIVENGFFKSMKIPTEWLVQLFKVTINTTSSRLFADISPFSSHDDNKKTNKAI